jgi:hypothetical protein
MHSTFLIREALDLVDWCTIANAPTDTGLVPICRLIVSQGSIAEKSVSHYLPKLWSRTSRSMSALACCRQLSVEVAEKLIFQESLVVAEQQ